MQIDDDHQGDDDVRRRLDKIDEELRMLRGDLQPSDDPKDFGDAGTEITGLEERQQMLDVLENEKRRLLGRLGEPPR